MPHVVVLYSGNLDAQTDMGALCRSLAGAMRAVCDEAGRPVFPVGGIRVLAYPAAHHAVADGQAERAFCYVNLRMGRGRSAAVQRRVGQTLAEAARAHFAPLMAQRALGLTLQVDEGGEVFDAKLGNLHDLFTTP